MFLNKLKKWWTAWKNLYMYIFDVDDAEYSMFCAMISIASVTIIVVFTYKIILLNYQQRPVLNEETENNDESVEQTIANAVAAVREYKLNSISVTGYRLIQQDSQNAETLLSYLEKKYDLESLQKDTNETEQSDIPNADVQACDFENLL